MRNKKILLLLLVFMLSIASPIISTQAANEAEVSTIIMTETETQMPIDIEPIKDETELRKELANSYVRLETKYQKEKTVSRTIIGALSFGVIVLFVILINVILYYRKKIRNMKNSVNKNTIKEEQTEVQISLKNEIPEKKAEKILQEDTAKKTIKETEPKKTVLKQKYSEEKLQKETPLKENIQKQKIKTVSKKPKKVKSEIGKNGLEIFDFNDEE